MTSLISKANGRFRGLGKIGCRHAEAAVSSRFLETRTIAKVITKGKGETEIVERSTHEEEGTVRNKFCALYIRADFKRRFIYFAETCREHYLPNLADLVCEPKMGGYDSYHKSYIRSSICTQCQRRSSQQLGMLRRPQTAKKGRRRRLNHYACPAANRE